MVATMGHGLDAVRVRGLATADALNAAYTRVYEQLHAQTQLLAFMDCFHIIGASKSASLMRLGARAASATRFCIVAASSSCRPGVRPNSQ